MFGTHFSLKAMEQNRALPIPLVPVGASYILPAFYGRLTHRWGALNFQKMFFFEGTCFIFTLTHIPIIDPFYIILERICFHPLALLIFVFQAVLSASPSQTPILDHICKGNPIFLTGISRMDIFF